MFVIMVVSLAATELRVRPITWAQPVIGSSVGNFYRVSDGLYRSEQPGTDGFSELSALGVGEVLNLREFHSDDDEASATRMTLHRIAIDTGALSETHLTEALKIITHRKAPLLVHCWHGSDRTGAVIAAYRMVVEGWPRQQAIDEFRNGGFGYHETFYPDIVALLETLDVEAIRRRIDLK